MWVCVYVHNSSHALMRQRIRTHSEEEETKKSQMKTGEQIRIVRSEKIGLLVKQIEIPRYSNIIRAIEKKN